MSENEMKTEVVLPGVVEPAGLIVRRGAVPEPGPGEVLVEMQASGVSFAEQGMRRDRYPGQPRFPFVLGYDLVGRVIAVGEGVDASLRGRRVAAIVKVGGWSTHVLVDARMVVPVPDSLDAAEAETVVVNGVTAWQMLHRKARVREGQTVLVHGANGGVGSTLVQLARHAGLRVIGTASPRHHESLRALGVEPLDYADLDLAGAVRRLAPAGVDAAFDHLGRASFQRSFALLARGGTLVAYGTAAQRDDDNSVVAEFVRIFAQLSLWSALPNGRHALFYDLWGGKRLRPARFRAEMTADLARVLELMAGGVLDAHVAALVPLDEAARAMELAESRTVYGKVVIVP